MHRSLAVGFFALMILLGAAATPAASDIVEIESVRAYFVGWDVFTRSRLSPQDVVRMKRVLIEISDAGLARNFVEWLRLEDLRARLNSDPADARLTIEISHADGSSKLYYSDKAELYSADSTRSRPVGEEFLARFDVARKK